jgi:thiosulfate reductase cytochrome b subunit
MAINGIYNSTGKSKPKNHTKTIIIKTAEYVPVHLAQIWMLSPLNLTWIVLSSFSGRWWDNNRSKSKRQSCLSIHKPTAHYSMVICLLELNRLLHFSV